MTILSSQLTEPLWTGPGIKSGISVHELISTSKKKEKKVQAWNEWLNILPEILASEKKATTSVTKILKILHGANCSWPLHFEFSDFFCVLLLHMYGRVCLQDAAGSRAEAGEAEQQTQSGAGGETSRWRETQGTIPPPPPPFSVTMFSCCVIGLGLCRA